MLEKLKYRDKGSFNLKKFIDENTIMKDDGCANTSFYIATVVMADKKIVRTLSNINIIDHGEWFDFNGKNWLELNDSVKVEYEITIYEGV